MAKSIIQATGDYVVQKWAGEKLGWQGVSEHKDLSNAHAKAATLLLGGETAVRITSSIVLKLKRARK